MKKITNGFTLAEVLVTLLVIGIVSAITIPALLSNVNDRALKSQKKALQVRLTNAIMNMPRIKNYGTFTKDGNGTITVDNAAESFIIDGLSKVYKVTNICGSNELKKCGIPEKIIRLDGGAAVNFPTTRQALLGYTGGFDHRNFSNTKAAAFQTPNGESVAVYYDPSACSALPQGTTTSNLQSRICVNFVYDVNGLKAPNQVGKDIGIVTAVYRDEITVVAPELYEKRYIAGTQNTVPFYSDNNTDARALCAKENRDLRVPTLDEGIAIATNQGLLFAGQHNISFWTSTVTAPGSTGSAYYITLNTTATNMGGSVFNVLAKTQKSNLLCVWE